MLDVGMLVYAGLFVLAVWRKVCFYWCCGMWLSILNYMSLLYLLVGTALGYLLIGFYQAAQIPVDVVEYPELKDLWSVGWLKPFVLLAPIATCVTVALGWLLTESHIFEIHKRLSMTKHDRAVQIIALPTVFGLMALASMLPVFELTTGSITAEMLKSPWYDFQPLNILSLFQARQPGDKPASWNDAKLLAFWRYETCMYVADLFEAWVLYQFGRLVLEQVRESMSKEEETSALDSETPAHLSKVERDLQDSHAAVTSLTWVGTSLFVVTCVAQSAASLWPYLGGSQEDQEALMSHLQVAGFVTSCAAIYNLVVVEQAFHRHFEPLRPLLKFMTVKMLVSLCFLQKAVLTGLQIFNQYLPGAMQTVIRRVPLVGDIVHLTDLQIHLFYPALIIYECLLLAILHLLVWKSNEPWYKESQKESLNYTENDPLLLKG
mmetsp:Transcript_12965/g.35275  ORF Transcript_12965/g.35275 Transcript_12965/m.35275 type:complete len:434 (-) Transcript_12965:52-1353(-)